MCCRYLRLTLCCPSLRDSINSPLPSLPLPTLLPTPLQQLPLRPPLGLPRHLHRRRARAKSHVPRSPARHAHPPPLPPTHPSFTNCCDLACLSCCVVGVCVHGQLRCDVSGGDSVACWCVQPTLLLCVCRLCLHVDTLRERREGREGGREEGVINLE